MFNIYGLQFHLSMSENNDLFKGEINNFDLYFYFSLLPNTG